MYLSPKHIQRTFTGLFLVTLLGNTYAQSFNQNFVRERTPLVPVATEAALETASADATKIQTTIQYFDGLGRPLQTVQVKGSPDGLKDVIQPVAYDQYGREAIKYLPYAASGTLGSYRTNALAGTSGYSNSAQKVFYQQTGQGYKTMADPYAVTVFELSPLNRVTEQGAPGAPWQPATRTVTAGRTAVTEYLTNNQTSFSTALPNTTGSQQVVNYSVGSTGELVRGTSAGVYYGSGELYVTRIKDENWITENGCLGTTEEYKDKEGRVILKRTYNKLSTTQGEMLSTYYVYDDFGNLAYVLPPGSQADAAKPVNDLLNNYCYRYRYDERNRMVQKRVPGKGWEFMVYNKLDQVVLTQDALQRNKAPQEWAMTKYNAFGQVIITGIYQDAGTTADGNANSPVLTRFTALQSAVNTQTGTLWDKRGTSGTLGYDISSYPGTWTTTLQVNYYDDYDNIPGLPATFTALSNIMTRPVGLLTATVTTVLNAPANKLYTVNYYDKEARLITTYKQHYKGQVLSPNNYDKVTTTYNFTDQVTTTKRQHYVNNSGLSLRVTVDNKYIYDHMGRKVKTWQTMKTANNAADTSILMSQQVYNEVGQLRTKYLHSRDSTNLNNFRQQIEYLYNERGWLSQIGDPDNVTGRSIFGTKLFYNEGANKNYNGNIGGISWQTKVPANPTGLYQAKQTFTYTYDDLNRLLKARYNTVADKFNEELTYDNMGNILTLKRKNATGSGYLNDFTYNYTSGGTGNKLWSVNDIGTANQDASYTYDLNGNAITDTRNQVTGITYNLLNLPQTVFRTPGNITYTYDAIGTKLVKKVNGKEREYIGGIEYFDNTLEFIATEEGRARQNGTTHYIYEYYLKDHLGNTRATMMEDGSIIQVQDYYAFGLDMNPGNNITSGLDNKYKYNGKETQDELGGQYDYGARFYDPVIGRFNSVDRQADEMRDHSVYNYGLSNPMRFTDPDGNAPTDIIIRGAGNSSVTIKTDLIDIDVNASSLGVNFGGNYTLRGDDLIEAALDLGGIADQSGVIDALSTAYYGKKHDWQNAIISGISILPLGDIAKLGKLKKDVKIIENAIDAVSAESRVVKTEKKVITEALPKPGKGKGSVPPSQRDPKRVYSKAEKAEMLKKQNGKCIGCGETQTVDQVAGHHKKRHADGGTTTPDNGAALCNGCHVKIHQ